MQKQTPLEHSGAGHSAAAIPMFVVLLASYSINAMDRQIFPLVAADVRKEYGFSLADAGLLSTIFTLGMAIAGLPTGYLLARFSRKAVLQFGIAVFSAATALTAVSRGFGDMFVYRALTGVGEAMQFTTLLAITAAYFVRYRSTAIGTVNAFFGAGAIIGPTLGARLLSQYQSWRVPLVVFGLFGLLAIIIVAAAVRSWFTETKFAETRFTETKLAETRDGGHERAHLGGAPALANRNTITLTFMGLIAGLFFYGFLGMYPTYLREHLHFSSREAGYIMSMYGFGGLTSMAGGWAGDRWSPRAVLSAAFASAAGVGYLLFHTERHLFVQASLSFLWASIVSGTIYVNLGGYHVKAVRSSLASKASGIFVTSFYTSAAVAGYTFGWIVNRTDWMTAGAIQLSALGIIAACLALTLQAKEMSLADRPVRKTAVAAPADAK